MHSSLNRGKYNSQMLERPFMIDARVYHDILEHCAAKAPNEAAGLLWMTSKGVIVAQDAVANAHPDPRRSAMIQIADVTALTRAAAARGLRLSGAYHSHPNGKSSLSPQDRQQFDRYPWLMVIALQNGYVLRAAAYFRALNGSARWSQIRLIQPADAR